MKYYIFSLLGHHHHHPHPPPPNDQNFQLLQQKIDQLHNNALQLTETYNSKLLQLQQQIESLQLENSKIYHALEQKNLHNKEKQTYLQLSIKPVYQIELWSQRTDYDSQYFILIYLENEIVVRIACKIDRCDQEKRHLHTAIEDGVSAEKIEISQLSKSISLQNTLNLQYSQRIHNMSNQEQVKQLFRSLKERNFDL
ncbi:hypothetical protein pb186bvf_000190 [Paramecium bursaria]